MPAPKLSQRLRRLVRTTGAERVALLTERPRPRLAARLGATAYDAGDPELHLRLAAAGRQDLIVDLGSPRGVQRRFALLVYHLAPGGTLALRLPPKGPARQGLLRQVRRIKALQSAGSVRPPGIGEVDDRSTRERDLAALAFSLRDLRRDGPLLLAVNDVALLALVGESDANRWLELRGGPNRVLETLPPVAFASRCQLRTFPAEAVPVPDRFRVPELSLREFHGVVCRGRQAAHTDDLVLPASFRRYTRKRWSQVRLANWSPDFMRAPDGEVDDELRGTWYLLDNAWRGHFGHVLTEMVGLLWGWDRAQAHHPGVRALTFANEWHGGLADWERELFSAYGVTDVHVAQRPVRVERLVTATSMFVQPSDVHPGLADIYSRIGERLASGAAQRSWPRRIFSTRSDEKRSCRNRAEVESWFVEAGFTVVRPEEHRLADQVAMYRRAEVIAGFAGSGMFQIALTGVPKHVITVGSEAYIAPNEYLISSVVGHRLDRVYCRRDSPDRDQGNWRESFVSTYAFDPGREGVFLRQVLAEL